MVSIYKWRPTPTGIDILCPQCERWLRPRFGSKEQAMASPTATKAEREQFLTGLCSDECWNKYLGIE